MDLIRVSLKDPMMRNHWFEVTVPLTEERFLKLREQYAQWSATNCTGIDAGNKYCGLFMRDHCAEWNGMNGVDKLASASAVSCRKVKVAPY